MRRGHYRPFGPFRAFVIKTGAHACYCFRACAPAFGAKPDGCRAEQSMTAGCGGKRIDVSILMTRACVKALRNARTLAAPPEHRYRRRTFMPVQSFRLSLRFFLPLGLVLELFAYAVV